MKSLDDLLNLVPSPSAPPAVAPDTDAVARVASAPSDRPAHALLKDIAIEGAEALEHAWRAEYDRLLVAGGGAEDAPSIALCEHIVGVAGATVREAMFTPDNFHLTASFIADDCAGLRAEWAPQWLRWCPGDDAMGLTRGGEDGFLLRWGKGRGPSGPIRYLPLIAGHKSWLVLSDDATKDAAHELVRTLVLRLACMMSKDVRFSLIAPVSGAQAFPRQELLPSRRFIRAEDLSEILEGIKGDITTTTQKMMGGAGFHQRSREEQKLAGGYEVVCALDMGSSRTTAYNNANIVNMLADIARQGPAVGRYLLAHVDVSADEKHAGIRGNDPNRLPLGLDRLRDCVHIIDLRTLARDGVEADRLPPPPLHVRILQSLGRAAADGAFNVIPRGAWWTHRAAHFVQTPLSDREDGPTVLFGEEPDGQRRTVTAGVLAGQTGSGKSFTLSALILGLAMRYPPEELQFYLVDLKGGTEFNIYRQVPHVRIIATDEALPYVSAMLRTLEEEMDRRNTRLFNDCNDGHGQFKDITAYHKGGQPRGPAPRILLVVDEYQKLFEDTEQAGQAMAVFKNLASRGRSAGIHMLLASQSMRPSGMMQAKDLFNNIALRMAMKLPDATIDAMEEFSRDGRRLLRSDVTQPGQILVNSHSGATGSEYQTGYVAVLDGRSAAEREGRDTSKDDVNVRLAPVFAKFAALAATRTDAQKAHWPRLEIIDGKAQPTLSSSFLLCRMRETGVPLDAAALVALAAETADRGGLAPNVLDAQIRPVPLLLGRDTSLYGQACVVLRRADRQNMMAVVKDNRVQCKMLAGVILSLATLSRDVVGSVRILNTALYADNFAKVIADALALAGHAQMPDHWRMSDNPDDADAFVPPSSPEGGTDVLILIGPDRAVDLRLPAAAGAFPARQPDSALQKRLKEGPEKGQHTIMLFDTITEAEKVIPRPMIEKGMEWVVYDVMTNDLKKALNLTTLLKRTDMKTQENLTTVYVMGPAQATTRVTLFGE